MTNDSYDIKNSTTEQDASAASFLLPLPLSSSGVVQGIVFSEIIGKPKALSKGRWKR